MPPVADPITRFSGKFSFLSNFYKVYVPYTHQVCKTSKICDEKQFHSYPTLEGAFQAAKTLQPREIKILRTILDPADAKQFGQKVTLREDWEDVKERIMLHLLRHKFNPTFYQRLSWKLIDTYPRRLCEGNDWGDRYWGCDPMTLEGKNRLGVLLMQVREEVWYVTQDIYPRKFGLPMRFDAAQGQD